MARDGTRLERARPDSLRPEREKHSGLAGFERFVAGLLLEDGRPMELYPAQRRVLRDHFAGIRELVVIMPKKQGKTTVLGALALHHLLTVDGAEVVIAAASRDQARILFKQAAGLVQRSGLDDVFTVKPGYGEIRLLVDGPHTVGARIRVLAADSATADGVIPTLALVDELHRHPSAELYGVFRDGLGPRDGQMVTISTAGADVFSPLGELRTRAHELPGFTRRGMHNYARSEDGSFALHEWCLGPDDDVNDVRAVKRANPAPWQTVERLRERLRSPSTTPWQWARFACGIWGLDHDSWITPEMWDACAGLPSIPEGSRGVVCAIDAGLRRDTTAAVLALRDEDDVIHAIFRVWEPAVRDDVDLGMVEEYVRELARRYPRMRLVYDPYLFQRSAQILASEGIVGLDYPQVDSRMVPASEELYTIVSGGMLRHGGDQVARRHALATVAKSTIRGVRIAKDDRRAPNDAIVALAMAVDTLSRSPERRSRYEDPDQHLLVV